MMIHESKHKTTDGQRRTLPPTIVARKSSELEPSRVNALRHRLGNQSVQRLMGEMAGHSKGSVQTRSPAIQAKLTISRPGDVHEREADRVAEAVMRMPNDSHKTISPMSTNLSSQVQRRCVECDEDQKKKGNVSVSRKSSGTAATPVPPPVASNIQAMRGGGSALPAVTRAFFEPRLGTDLSAVRVHTDARADETAASINAQAFTVGSDIVFAKGRYAPNSNAGQKLLAHELVHVVQQSAGVVTPFSIQRTPGGYSAECAKLSDNRSLRGLIRGTEAHSLITEDFKSRVIGATGASIPGASADPKRTDAICGGPSTMIDPEEIGDPGPQAGRGKVDLARKNDTILEIAEIKPASLECLVDGEVQLTRYIYQGNLDRAPEGKRDYELKAWKRRKGIKTLVPMKPSTYPAKTLRVLDIQGELRIVMAWCKPGLLAYQVSLDDEKKEKEKEKKKESGPSELLPELLKKLGKEIAPWLARAGLFDIGMALARVMLAWVAAPLAALAAVVLGIAFFWDEIKSLAGKIAGVIRAVWDRIAGLAEWVRSTFTSILGKLHELGVKLAELGSWLAGKIASLVKKLAEGAVWVAGRIAAGAKWVGGKIASGAEAFWDWLWGSDVDPIYPVIDIPVTKERTCRTVSYEDTIIKLPADLLFPINEWVLRPEADALLKDAAKKIASMLQKDDWIMFEGYADIIGSTEYNQRLSERRAEAVRSWFVAHGVVPMPRTRIEGYGKAMARAKANDEEGRKQDRRVDIWLPKRGGTRTMCW